MTFCIFSRPQITPIKHHGWSEHEIVSLRIHSGDTGLVSCPHRLMWTNDTQIPGSALIAVTFKSGHGGVEGLLSRGKDSL